MADQTLLVLGCAISFIVLTGVYVHLRASFERARENPVREVERERPRAQRGLGRAA